MGSKGGATEVKGHPYWSDINWPNVEKGLVEPQIKPKIKIKNLATEGNKKYISGLRREQNKDL